MGTFICNRCKKRWPDVAYFCCPMCYPRWAIFHTVLLIVSLCVFTIALLTAIGWFAGWLS